MFDTLVVIFQFLILLMQILRKHSEIGPFCVCFALYANTTRKLPTRHSALLLIINKTIVTLKEVSAANV